MGFFPSPEYPQLVVLSRNDSIVDYLVAADVNLDGRSDVVAVNSFAGVPSIMVYMALPLGGYSEPVVAVTNIGATHLSYPRPCDLNADGYVEIVVGLDTTLAIALNRAGNLTAASLVPIVASGTAGPFASWSTILCADVTQDGRADLITVDTANNQLVVYENAAPHFNGSTFVKHMLLSLESIEWSGVRRWPFATADLFVANDDGGPGTVLELVAAPTASSGLVIFSVSMLTASPVVTFTRLLSSSLYPSTIEVVDLDRSSRLDVLLALGSPDVISDSRLLCFFQDESGAFPLVPIVIGDPGSPIYSMSLLDRNDDDLIDVVVSVMDFTASHYAVLGMWGIAPGRLGQPVPMLQGTSAVFYCASAISVRQQYSTAFPVFAALNNAQASVLLLTAPLLQSSGVSPMASAPQTEVTSGSLSRARAIQAYDMNLDSITDLVLVSKLGQLFVVLGRGLGTFNSVQIEVTLNGSIAAAQRKSVLVFDSNADGVLDIACIVTDQLGGAKQVALFVARERVDWWRVTVSAFVDPSISNPTQLAMFDANVDHWPDLLVLCESAPGLLLLLHSGTVSADFFASPIPVTIDGLNTAILSVDSVTAIIAGFLGWPPPQVSSIALALTNRTVLFVVSTVAGNVSAGWQVRAIYNTSDAVETLTQLGPDILVHTSSLEPACVGEAFIRPESALVAGSLSNIRANGRYEINEICALNWTGFAANISVFLTIVQLESEECCDFLELFAGNGTRVASFSGTLALPVSFSLPATGVKLLWTSDFSIAARGFRIVWQLGSGPGSPPSPPPPPPPVAPPMFASLWRVRFFPAIAQINDRVALVGGPFITGSNDDSLFTDIAGTALTMDAANAGLLPDIVALTEKAAYFWLDSINSSASSSGFDGVAPGRRETASNLPGTAVVPTVDVDGDGDVDMIVSTTSGLVVVAGPDSLFRPYPRTSRELYNGAVMARECGFNFACVVRMCIAGCSSCVQDTLMLPSGRYFGCFGDAAFELRARALSIGGPPGGSVIIDCSSPIDADGYLFAVTEGGSLKLHDMSIVNARIGLLESSAGTDGSSGSPLVVSGVGASLTLFNMTLANCSSHGAYGGAIRVSDGATLLLQNVRVVDSSVRGSVDGGGGGGGGAVALLGSGTSLRALDVAFVGCRALFGSGGAVHAGSSAPGEGAHIELIRVVFSRNSAPSGSGGALWLASSSGRVRASLVNVTAIANNAGLMGGDVAIYAPTVEPSLVSFDLFDSTDAHAGIVGGSIGLALAGSRSAPISLNHISIVGASCDWAGGAVAILTPNVFSATFAASNDGVAQLARARALPGAALPDGVADASATVVQFSGATQLRGGRAGRYGGSLFVCGVHAAGSRDLLSLSNNTAGVAGSTLYLCVCDEGGSATSSQCDPQNHFAANVSAAAAVTAGASEVMTWVGVVSGPPRFLFVRDESPLPLSRATGMTLDSGAIGMRDVFGAESFDDRTTLSLLWSDAAIDARVRIEGANALLAVEGAFDLSRASFTVLNLADSSIYMLPQQLDAALLNSAILGGAPRLLSFPLLITACPKSFGRISRDDAPVVCGECPPGTTTKASTILPCAGLASCPVNSVRVIANVSASDRDGECACVQGYVRVGTGDTLECVACPIGGFCAGGSAPPVAREGYFPVPNARASSGGVMFLACKRPKACVGGPSVCSLSTRGFLCADCVPSFYTDTSGICARCPQRRGTAIGPLSVLPALLMLCSGVFIAISLRIRSKVIALEREQEARLGHNDIVRARPLPRSPSMLVTYLQTVGIIAGSNLNWSSRSKSAFLVFELSGLDLKILSTACVFDNYWFQWVYAVAVPAIIALFVVALVYGISAACPGRLARGDRNLFLKRGMLVLGNLAFIPCARNALLFFDCTRFPDGTWRLDAELSLRCFDATWFALLPIAVVAGTVYVAMLPLLGMYWLFKNHDDLRDATTTFWLGSLYGHLRARFWYFEIVHLCKRLVIVVASLFFSQLQVIMIAILCNVFLLSGFLQARVHPYVADKHNRLETVLGVSVTLVLFLGFLSFADRYPSALAQLVADLLLIFILVSTLAFAGVAAIKESLSYIQARHKKQLALVDETGLDRFISGVVRDAFDEAVRELGNQGADQVFHELLKTGEIRIKSDSELARRRAESGRPMISSVAAVPLDTLSPQTQASVAHVPRSSSSTSSSSSS